MKDYEGELDRALAGKTGELLERLEATLPTDCGAIVLMYNREGGNLTLVSAALGGEPGDELKILREAQRAMYKRETEQGAVERDFVSAAIGPEKLGPHSDVLVSSAAVTQIGAHERVRVWSRGGLAGELVVSLGDGEKIAALLGLVEHSPSRSA